VKKMPSNGPSRLAQSIDTRSDNSEINFLGKCCDWNRARWHMLNVFACVTSKLAHCKREIKMTPIATILSRMRGFARLKITGSGLDNWIYWQFYYSYNQL
jgi:hypothetical protein